ncbi:MAG TPA: penicillin-binding transpeptidase domain-containing protein, partial [Lentimicrobium sp.]|nr:penicillin-binding transpeptidase domain-containing protein [Lentimicrobium sp.]
SGLEKQYEHFLRGQKGRQDIIKDNTGTIQKITSITPPIIGATVKTTIDFSIQEQVEQLFHDQIGTIAILDLKNGGLICLVSHPNFDPDALSGIITADLWESIINDPSRPLQNRFSQGLYSPGSVFKLVVSLAGLSENVIAPDTKVLCTGSILIYDRFFKCWQPGGHGLVNLPEAIKGSCNVYFYQLGKKLDVDQIAFYARQLGLGKPSNIDLPNEKDGIIPTKSWKEKEKNQPWFPGETISVSIGGGWVSVTPVQILRMVSMIALRGKEPDIHLVDRIERDNKILYSFKQSSSYCTIDKKHFEPVIEGMWEAVNDDGTARRTALEGLNICGKTGTQQIISKENPNYNLLSKQPRFRPHAWFASFAPRDNPRYAVVVLVENGGDAGQIAVPYAEQVYRLLFNRERNV